MSSRTPAPLPITPEQAQQLEAIWIEHSRPVYQALLAITRNEADAADLLSLTFQRLAVRLSDLPSGGALRGYLITAARNLAIDTARQDSARRSRHDEIAAGATGQSTVTTSPQGDRDLREAIVRALSTLPGDQRRAVEGRLLRGLAFETIARQEGTSLKTVASRFNYGLRKIREQLRPYYDCITSQPMKKPSTPADENQPLIRPLDPKRMPSTVPGLDGLAAFAPDDSVEETEDIPADEIGDEELDGYVSEEDIESPEEVVDYVVTSEETPVEFNELFVIQTLDGGPVIFDESEESEESEEGEEESGDYEGEYGEEESEGEEGPIDPRILYMTGGIGGETPTGSGDPAWAFRGGDDAGGEVAGSADLGAGAEAPVETLAPITEDASEEVVAEIELADSEETDGPDALAALEAELPMVEVVTGSPAAIAQAELSDLDGTELAGLNEITIDAEGETALAASETFVPKADLPAGPTTASADAPAEATDAPLPATPAVTTASHGPATATVLGAAFAAGTVLQSKLPTKKRRA